MSEEIKNDIVAAMKSYCSWLILCHENPDGDTLGCGLALYSLALRLGKKARIGGKSALPDRYGFLPGAEKYEVIDKISRGMAGGSLVFCIDTSTAARAPYGASDAEMFTDTVNIDHHGDNERFCRLNLIDGTASATAEIVIWLMDGVWALDKDTAVCLYTALSTDNGNFRYSSTTPRSHLCAAKLLEAGVNPSIVDDCVNQNMSRETLTLWGRAMTDVELFAGGQAAMFGLEKKEFDSLGLGSSAVDGLVNMLLRIRGVRIAILISNADGVCKASIRTRQPYSARELAHKFGGGGHVCAAGTKVQGTYSEARAALKAETEKYAADRLSSDKQA